MNTSPSGFDFNDGAPSLLLHRIPIGEADAILFHPATLQLFIERLGTALGTSAAVVGKPEAPDRGRRVDAQSSTACFGHRPHLSRLTLHVSHTCNLACSYCYASGGDYGLGKKVMKSEEALDLLSRAFNAFDIECLMFFGGEPFLNVDVITDCCILVTELFERKLISKLPEFAVISNLAGSGPRFERFLAVCQKFDIGITVSIDGPPEIHDRNRPTVNGRGSYSRVHENFILAKQAGIKLGIECTYTEEHWKRGISVLELMRFFHREFGESHTHIAPASCSPKSSERAALEHLIATYCEALEYMVATSGTPEYLSVDIGKRLLQAIANQEPISEYCPAGNTELTIGPEGQLYPCFMFVGHDGFQMGDLRDGNFWLSPHGAELLGEVDKNGKHRHPICKQCWARNLCSGCIGGDFLETGSLAIKPQCAMIMATAAEVIVRMAEKVEGVSMGAYGYRHRSAYLNYVDEFFEIRR